MAGGVWAYEERYSFSTAMTRSLTPGPLGQSFHSLSSRMQYTSSLRRRVQLNVAPT